MIKFAGNCGCGVFCAVLEFAFTSYFYKIGSIDKYFTILSHLVQITAKYDIILLYTLHYIRLKFSKKPDTGSWGGRIMSYLILIASLKQLMINKMYISDTPKLLYSILDLFLHGKKLLKFPTLLLI